MHRSNPPRPFLGGSDIGHLWLHERRCFSAAIDISSALDQFQCILFNKLPFEVRVRIFEYACTPSPDPDRPFRSDRTYYRPGYHCTEKSHPALLLTCKRVFSEARFLPVSQVEHTLYLFQGPWRITPEDYGARGQIIAWQRQLTPEQRERVEYVRFFIQQFRLEGLGRFPGLPHLTFRARHLNITLRHADWWSWESPPESSDRLGICPWLKGRTSHQRMLAEPLEPGLDYLRERMVEGTWGWQMGRIRALETLTMELETDVMKKPQMREVVERAKYWLFPIGESEALKWDGKVRESVWKGVANLKDDSLPLLNTPRRVPGRLEEAREATRTYHVVKMKWKKAKIQEETDTAWERRYW